MGRCSQFICWLLPLPLRLPPGHPNIIRIGHLNLSIRIHTIWTVRLHRFDHLRDRQVRSSRKVYQLHSSQIFENQTRFGSVPCAADYLRVSCESHDLTHPVGSAASSGRCTDDGRVVVQWDRWRFVPFLFALRAGSDTRKAPISTRAKMFSSFIHGDLCPKAHVMRSCLLQGRRLG